jgi:integrase
MTVAKDALVEWMEWREMCGKAPNTIRSQHIMLTSFFKKFKLNERMVAAITHHNMHVFVNDGSTVKAGTRRSRLAALRSFFDYCAGRGYCLGNPAKLVKVNYRILTHRQREPNKRKPFTVKEIDRLIGATNADPWWCFAILVGYETGLRLGDIARLEWDCIVKNEEGEALSLVVWTDKRDRRVRLFVSPGLRAALALPIKMAGTTFMWPLQARIVADPHKRAILSGQFADICERAHIVGKSFHCLRNTYIQRCMDNGIEIHHIASCVGHKNIKTTEGYLE